MVVGLSDKYMMKMEYHKKISNMKIGETIETCIKETVHEYCVKEVYMNYVNSIPRTAELLLSTDLDNIPDKYYKRKKLLLESDFTCSMCHNKEWLEKPIPLEIDHIDGNNSNWNKNNVRAVCLNCHAQTYTFRGRNINTGRKIVSDLELIKCINESKNIRQTLIKAKLTPKGLNYERVRTLMFKHSISFLHK